jgi:putative SOS response-associated peptidase YedK
MTNMDDAIALAFDPYGDRVAGEEVKHYPPHEATTTTITTTTSCNQGADLHDHKVAGMENDGVERWMTMLRRRPVGSKMQ